MSEFKSGFFSLIGSPNVGKSTLINALVGQKVAIVSKRAQTTRNRITGVLTKPDYQMIFLDTPGVQQPRNKLGEYMARIAYDALNEVEGVLFVADCAAGIMGKDEALLERIAGAKAPVIALLNKCDIAGESVAPLKERLAKYSFLKGIIAISALTGEGLGELSAQLETLLVPGPKFFPDEFYTDQPERAICAEFIREQALELLEEEVPHGIGVEIAKISPREDGALIDVYANIYCERDSHKGIIIGKNGGMLRKIGERARHELEWLLGARVNLQLWVKVKRDWRNNISMIRELGYE